MKSTFVKRTLTLCLTLALLLGLATAYADPPGTERVNVDSAGAQATSGHSFAPSISADGRYVAFYSYATNLVSGDTNMRQDVFVRDRQTNTTTRVSVDSAGAEGNGPRLRSNSPTSPKRHDPRSAPQPASWCRDQATFCRYAP